MKTLFYIVRKETNGRSLWIEDESDLLSARNRLHELEAIWPGKFQIVNAVSEQAVSNDSVVAADSRNRHGHRTPV